MSNLIFFVVDFSIFLMACLTRDMLEKIEKGLSLIDGNVQMETKFNRGRSDGFPYVIHFVKRARRTQIHRLRMLHYECVSNG